MSAAGRKAPPSAGRRALSETPGPPRPPSGRLHSARAFSLQSPDRWPACPLCCPDPSLPTSPGRPGSTPRGSGRLWDNPRPDLRWPPGPRCFPNGWSADGFPQAAAGKPRFPPAFSPAPGTAAHPTAALRPAAAPPNEICRYTRAPPGDTLAKNQKSAEIKSVSVP